MNPEDAQAMLNAFLPFNNKKLTMKVKRKLDELEFALREVVATGAGV